MSHGVVDFFFGYHLFEWNLGAHAYYFGVVWMKQDNYVV
jgi:hypothetical protein